MDKQANINRRSFLQSTALAGAGVVVNPVQLFHTKYLSKRGSAAKPTIRMAFVGCGLRGQSHINLCLKRNDCEVVALAEVDSTMITKTKDLFSKFNKTVPKIYQDGELDYLNLFDNEEIDAVIISTPWKWHIPMAIASMKAGVYCGLEVGGAFSIDDCWALINTYEETGTPLFFLENVCYRRDVMAVLNMVRNNLFGELIHLEGGYQHDLRGVKFNDGKTPYNSGAEFGENGFSEAKWRTTHSVYRNGELYPTHGIGPVAQYININRGNRFVHLTSMSTKARGLHEYIVNHEKGGANHPNAKVNFKLGDKVTTLIQTSNGESIVLHHDTNLPRPYSLGFRVQGTKGLWMAVNKSIYVEGKSSSHRWEDADAYLKKYDHSIWKKKEEEAKGAGHGGMDFFLMDAFVESAKQGSVPVFDVYDAASWMAITPLSEQSIAMGSQPQAFPDFTRGSWMHRKPIFAFDDQF
ncbi:MAG: Gfo/Idh/MocA family oxidoreductase [Bacteroidota bacterium]